MSLALLFPAVLFGIVWLFVPIVRQTGTEIFGILLLAGSGFYVWQARRLEVSEVGITLYHYGLKSELRWEDARLFAILYTSKSGEATLLELSGKKAIIRWPRNKMIYSDMSADEAHQLEEYIVAKTGLKLYHL